MNVIINRLVVLLIFFLQRRIVYLPFKQGFTISDNCFTEPENFDLVGLIFHALQWSVILDLEFMHFLMKDKSF